MYYPNSIEEICYERDHIDRVLSEIKINFPDYFRQYLDTDAGNVVDDENLQKLAEHFGNSVKKRKKNVNKREVFTRLLSESIKSFEKDRDAYFEILDNESLEEHGDDPPYFKNTILRNKCPIIRATLQNKRATELDKYREAFKNSDPNELLEVVSNIVLFETEYKKGIYNPKTFDEINQVDELKFTPLLDEEYVVYGVIGGGIKSHFLYKLSPNIFPNRSRESIWALWYLTNKKTFGCMEDSEFLMIDRKKNITQQNYFYPYDLFSFYVINIFNLLKKEASHLDVELPINHRFISVDSFLSFVAQKNINEINELKKVVKDDGHGY